MKVRQFLRRGVVHPSSVRASPSLRWGWTKNQQKHNLNHVPGLTHGLDQKNEAGQHHHINEHLKLGWVLVDTWIQDIGEQGIKDGRLHALMGWIDRSRPALRPKD